MEQTKLNRLIDDLRTDVDMLLNTHYNLSENGIAGMRENISQITTKIQSIQKELTETHDQAITTAQNLMAYHYTYSNKTEIAYSLSNDLETYFKNFLEYFLNATEKTKDYDLEDRIKVLKPVMTKVRDHLDNLVNGDGSQISSADFEELSTTVNTLQDTCNSLETKYQNLQLQMNKYITPPDPYYIGKTFTDYPAGTIIQTYDCDERKFIKTLNYLLTTPKIYFCAEVGATGSCKITHTFALQNTANVCFKTYLNTTLIDERIVAISASSEPQDLSFELFDLALNQETKANNIYTTLVFQGAQSSNVISYTKIKTEITAPNAVILNKIRRLDAIQIHDKYYLNDCSTGYLKTCEISTDKMFKTSDIVWETTDIEAESCTTTCDKIQYRNDYQQGNNIYKFRLDSNNIIHVGQKADNYSQYAATAKAENSVDSMFMANLFPCCAFENNNYFYKGSLENGKVYSSTTDYMRNVVTARGIKIHDQTVDNNFCIYGVYITTEGKVMIRRRGNSYVSFEIGEGFDANIYLDEHLGSYKYTFNVYVKYYDKIILYKVSFDTTTFTITDTIEMGAYDAFFEMQDNKYFVIKNKQLMFFDKDNNESSESE